LPCSPPLRAAARRAHRRELNVGTDVPG
jgi:hypothetical protein